MFLSIIIGILWIIFGIFAYRRAKKLIQAADNKKYGEIFVWTIGDTLILLIPILFTWPFALFIIFMIWLGKRPIWSKPSKF